MADENLKAAFDHAVDAALTDYLPSLDGATPQGALVNRWVIIAEVLQEDGSTALVRSFRSRMRVWEVDGLCYAGLNWGRNRGEV